MKHPAILLLLAVCVLASCADGGGDEPGEAPDDSSSSSAPEAPAEPGSTGPAGAVGPGFSGGGEPPSDRVESDEAKSVLTFQGWRQAHMGRELQHEVRELPSGAMESALRYSVQDPPGMFQFEAPYRAEPTEGNLETAGSLYLSNDGSGRLVAKSGTYEIGSEVDGSLSVTLQDIVVRPQGDESATTTESGSITGSLARLCIMVDRAMAAPAQPDNGDTVFTSREDATWSSSFCKSALEQLGLEAP